MFKNYPPLTPADLDPDFCCWAFGEKHFYSTLEVMEAWNERHGDKLMLKPQDTVSTDICRMGGIWAELGYPKSYEKPNKSET